MTESELRNRLDRALAASDATSEFYALTEELAESRADLANATIVLRFIEDHPTVDFGNPGPLVHFVEKFHGSGYETALVESVLRHPTAHTTWMLNRLLNGTTAPAERQKLIDVMAAVVSHPEADNDARQRASHYLER